MSAVNGKVTGTRSKRATQGTKAVARGEVRELVFDTGPLAIEYVHGAQLAAGLAITFLPDGYYDMGQPGYQEKELRGAGFDLIAVKQAVPNGYAQLDPEMIAQMMGQLPAYSAKIVVGPGSAGYQALRLFSGIENVSIVAMSPTIEGEPAPAQAMRASAYLLYDPTRAPEVESSEAIAVEFPRAVHFQLPHAGSPCRPSLEETGALLALVQSLARGEVVHPLLTLRRNRMQSPTALYYLGNHALERRRKKAAQAILHQAYALLDNSAITISYSRALAEGGKPKEAIAILERLVHLHREDAHLWAVKSYYEQLAGDPNAALESIQQAIKIMPDLDTFQKVERQLLSSLYGDMRKHQVMTKALLEKSRAELALSRGHGDGSFDGRKFAMLFGMAVAICIILAIVGVSFRLI